MDEHLELVEFVRRIRVSFPDEAVLTDNWLMERGWEPQEALYHWVEAFADRTTDAIRAENWALVREHTEFISGQLRVGSQDLERTVDVSYAENLMWDLDEAAKVQAWPHIAQEVRRLYEEEWGIPGA